MFRKSIACPVLLILSLVAGRGRAEEVRGVVKSVDPGKATITLEVGAAEQVYPVAADARFLGRFGKKAKKATTREIPGGLKGVKEGSELIAMTERRDATDVIAQGKVEGLQVKEKGKEKGKKNDKGKKKVKGKKKRKKVA